MHRLAVTCLITLLLALPARGQGKGHDTPFFKDTHPELSMSNAAILSQLDVPFVSLAQVFFQKENGCLIPLEGSDNAWKAGIEAEGFNHVSDRLSFHEKLYYSHFYGKNMGGPVLMDPAFNPINFLEEDFSSRGSKKRETYGMEGGISYSPSDALALGLNIDYTSADQVKYKDPRFQNVWMDMSIRPGMLFRLSDRFHLGVNLEYRRTLEKIAAKLYGSIDRDYSILVDQGNFYGGKERFEGDAGYISVSNERPLSHSFYGLSLQALATRGAARYSGELTVLYRNGYYGNRSSTSVVFCDFSGVDISYTGHFLVPQNGNLHKMTLEASYGLLNRYTNQYRHDAELGMSGKIVYLGQNHTFSRNEFAATGRYTFYGDTSSYLPKWELNAQAGVQGDIQHTMLYPFDRDWTSICVEVLADAAYNLSKGKNLFSFRGGVSFLQGFGAPRQDTMAGNATTTFRSFDDYSNRQFEYETAGRLGVEIALKYARAFSEKYVPYVKLSNRFYTLLSAPEFLDGGQRNIACIGLGCNF